mmetsp:Transcript_36189/g.59014  ORF Transcript_36189/g.59014 Transcript_36189/m.59014 type:complete len:244 (-) Transcript_36189:36-767(-)
MAMETLQSQHQMMCSPTQMGYCQSHLHYYYHRLPKMGWDCWTDRNLHQIDFGIGCLYCCRQKYQRRCSKPEHSLRRHPRRRFHEKTDNHRRVDNCRWQRICTVVYYCFHRRHHHQMHWKVVHLKGCRMVMGCCLQFQFRHPFREKIYIDRQSCIYRWRRIYMAVYYHLLVHHRCRHRQRVMERRMHLYPYRLRMLMSADPLQEMTKNQIQPQRELLSQRAMGQELLWMSRNLSSVRLAPNQMG